MGFRFRRTFKIGPGVRVNLSKSGLSTSIGPRGATVNISKRGTRGTVGVPGTGVSYSTLLSSTEPSAAKPGSGCAIVGGIVGVGMLVAMCSQTGTKSVADPTTAAAPAALDIGYVSARSLKCRRSPGAGSPVITSLARGAELSIAERKDGWARVVRADGDCWVSGQFVAASPQVSNSAAVSPPVAGLLSAPPAGHAARRHSRAHSRRSNAYSTGGCPCSGGTICIGPRGGRYCITSGGNKRYGV